jgi:myxalamid-type polyketide synthase MxaB
LHVKRTGAEALQSAAPENMADWHYETKEGSMMAEEPAPPALPSTHESPPVQLTIAIPGALDSLIYQPVSRCKPNHGEVEIRVHAAGLSFLDVLIALGVYSGEAATLGRECAGEIVAIGEGLNDLKVGDHVMGIARSSFAAFVTANADLIVRKPEPFSFAEAAAISSAFVTAYYTLIHLGKLSPGETVLIHSATGGVGLAAMQLAQRAGAVIFATAGTEEKREFLRARGVRYVMDSRSLNFAHEIMRFTDEAGVDVVLNALSGEFIPTSLSVLKDDGRFLEIGRQKIWTRQQVDDFKRVDEYHVIDLAAVSLENPGLIRFLLGEVLAGMNDGSLKPLPVQVFNSDKVVEAFRYMEQAKHIGKIVVSQTAEGVAQWAKGK